MEFLKTRIVLFLLPFLLYGEEDSQDLYSRLHEKDEKKEDSLSAYQKAFMIRENETNLFHFDLGFVVESFKLSQPSPGWISETTIINSSGYNGTLPVSGAPIQPNIELQWGARLELGCFLPFDNWLLYGQFDFIPASEAQGYSVSSTEQIVPNNVWIDGTFSGMNAGYFTNVETKQSVDYYNFTISMNRTVGLSNKVSTQFDIALKSTWITYTNTITYQGGAASAAETLVHYLRTNSWGLGPQLGVKGKIHLVKEFSLFSNLAGAVIFGPSSVYDRAVNTTNTANKTQIDDDHYMVTPFIGMDLGFLYERLMAGGQILRFTLGLDTNYYLNQFPQILVSNDTDIIQFSTKNVVSLGFFGILFTLGYDF